MLGLAAQPRAPEPDWPATGGRRVVPLPKDRAWMWSLGGPASRGRVSADGRVAAGRFLNASAPVLAVAFSTQSSLASLPIMVERSRDVLGAPASVANLVLPLAVAVFRMTSPVTNLAVVFFVAAVHGLHLGPAAILAGCVVAVAISVGSVGLPGQVSFIASVGPICLAMGVPTEIQHM